ncbi:MAG: hypothetical protein HQ474_12115 [Flammeovirgaceae bacterium]|nr:hypothetical protein [Flammeovirgaceae bacterium]
MTSLPELMKISSPIINISCAYGLAAESCTRGTDTIIDYRNRKLKRSSFRALSSVE